MSNINSKNTLHPSNLLRYLPEYRELRSDFSQFFEICRMPELATAASIQPLDRFESLPHGSIDAVIFFSDILVIPQVS